MTLPSRWPEGCSLRVSGLPKKAGPDDFEELKFIYGRRQHCEYELGSVGALGPDCSQQRPESSCERPRTLAVRLAECNFTTTSATTSQVPGVDKEHPGSKVWQPMNISSARQLNDRNHGADVRIRVSRYLFPHGCLWWRECPNCGKLSSYIGDAWEIDSKVLRLPPPPLKAFADNTQFKNRMAEDDREPDDWENRQGRRPRMRPLRDLDLCATTRHWSDRRASRRRHHRFLEEIQREMARRGAGGGSHRPHGLLPASRRRHLQGVPGSAGQQGLGGFKSDAAWSTSKPATRAGGSIRKNSKTGNPCPRSSPTLANFSGKRNVRFFGAGVPRRVPRRRRGRHRACRRSAAHLEPALLMSGCSNDSQESPTGGASGMIPRETGRGLSISGDHRVAAVERLVGATLVVALPPNGATVRRPLLGHYRTGGWRDDSAGERCDVGGHPQGVPLRSSGIRSFKGGPRGVLLELPQADFPVVDNGSFRRLGSSEVPVGCYSAANSDACSESRNPPLGARNRRLDPP